MAYDIRRCKEYSMPKAQWGREYYAKDAMGWLVPVLFVPYFDWTREGFKPNIVNYDIEVDGAFYSKADKCWKRREGKRYVTKGDIILAGLKQIWRDRKRIINKEWYHDEKAS